MERNRFLDIDLKFIPHPITNTVANVSGRTAIDRALSHLFMTRQGEKLYDSDFGIGIQDRLFELNSFLARDSLQTFVLAQINNYEPRINVLDFSVEAEQHNFTVNLSYNLKSDPQEVLTYQKTIKRIR